MTGREVYLGQRRSYAGSLCTVRYHGPLPGTKGDWLGVEWDDVSRGKHGGEYEGRRIFRCVSSSATAASFVRASRKPDDERTLLEAIKFKYAPASASGSGGTPLNGVTGDAIEISGKVVEEVGFDRIQKQLSTLSSLKIVLVDELVVSGIAPRGSSREETTEAQLELERTCPSIVELDVGWNPVETWQDIADLCVPFKKLKTLKASGLRLSDCSVDLGGDEGHPFQTLEELQLNECLLSPAQIAKILCPRPRSTSFPALKTLTLSSNNLDFFGLDKRTREECRCPSVTTIVLENNRLRDLSFVPNLFALFPGITALSLQGNTVTRLNLEAAPASSQTSFSRLETLNLARNQVSEYDFIDALPGLFPNLTSLRISRNPLYGEPQDPDPSTPSPETRRHDRSSAQSDSTSYYLTLARVPNLKSLNYTTITPRDREEGEIYYLSVAERELRTLLAHGSSDNQPTDVGEAGSRPSREETVKIARARHPLYSILCAKHDREDLILRFSEVAPGPPSNPLGRRSALDNYLPGTLGSRLVDAHFYMPPPPSPSGASNAAASAAAATVQAPTPLHQVLPTTVSVYRLKSLVARHFCLPALGFRLVYESHEYDPVEPINSSRNTGAGAAPGAAAGAEIQWAGWGDWDVDVAGGRDDDDDDDDENNTHKAETDPAGAGFQAHDDEDDDRPVRPLYVVREGHRFRKRETEILDGMRAWGDFLDLEAHDGTRQRRVRVRVEAGAGASYVASFL